MTLAEGLCLGTCAKVFNVAGPVLVYGISSSVIAGLITCILEWIG
ncbi:MAG: SpoVA/SpoVAEb family sporulation membrane protein [Clostridia bacterium]|nr:SpoVA/SpoVAEb family sporulation membrane protein [Clostridia bacterium]